MVRDLNHLSNLFEVRPPTLAYEENLDEKGKITFCIQEILRRRLIITKS
jgi:hypothetical protein